MIQQNDATFSQAEVRGTEVRGDENAKRHRQTEQKHAPDWKDASDSQKIEVLWRELARTREELASAQNALEVARRDNRELVRLDELTGLPNYRAFVERIGEEVQRAARFSLPLSILLLDLDNFDLLTCQVGMVGADEVLRGVAKTLQSSTRTVDIVARYGRHQFGAILPNTSQEGAILLAERLCLTIESHDVQGPNLCASFGVTTVTSDHLDGKNCIAQAYKAMRYSALTGRNRVTHAHQSSIQRVMPWGEVPSVHIVHSSGELVKI